MLGYTIADNVINHNQHLSDQGSSFSDFPFLCLMVGQGSVEDHTSKFQGESGRLR